MKGFAWKYIEKGAENFLLYLSETASLPNGQGFNVTADGKVITFCSKQEAEASLAHLGGELLDTSETTDIDTIMAWAINPSEAEITVSDVASALSLISTLWVTKKDAPKRFADRYDLELESQVFERASNNSKNDLSELSESELERIREMINIGFEWFGELKTSN